jgi:hypothetical protein
MKTKPIVNKKRGAAEVAGSQKPLTLMETLVAQGLPESEAAAAARFDAGLREGFKEFLRLNDLPQELVLKLVRGLAGARRRGIELTLRPYPPFAVLVTQGAA